MATKKKTLKRPRPAGNHRWSLNTVEKISTGIKGFDTILEGGIPRGRMLLVSGGTGTGKSVLSNEFLYRGITEFDQPGVLVTFEEPPEFIATNMASFGWDYAKLQRQKKLALVDISINKDEAIELNTDYDLEPLLIRIRHAIDRIGAERIVLDGLSVLFNRLQNRRQLRTLFRRICHEVNEKGVTAIATSESATSDTISEGDTIEQFVADGAIELTTIPGQHQMIRNILVRKLRGTSYSSGVEAFTITSEGVEVFNKMPIAAKPAKLSISRRVSFGVPGFEKISGGGIPEGHTLLVSGNTGTGKTLMCLQFLVAGAKAGEPSILVCLEETADQIRNVAAQFRFPLRRYEKEGKLLLLEVPLIDIYPYRVQQQIADAVLQMGAKRLVVDSLSSVESATLDREQVRQFIYQVCTFTKSYGITTMLSYLSSSIFGAAGGQLMGELTTNDLRLSSVVDGIVMLRYVERGRRIKRLLNILKLRGSQHSNAVFMYEIDKGGLQLGEQYEY